MSLPLPELRFRREMRAKYGDAFVDAALANVAAAPPLTEEQKIRVRRIFAQAQAQAKRPA